MHKLNLGRAYPALGVEVVPALPEHLPSVAERMRPEDALEIRLAYGYSPLKGLQTSLAASLVELGAVPGTELGAEPCAESGTKSGDCRAWTLLHKGQPELIFGVGRGSLLSSMGRPWMLSTGMLGTGEVRCLSIPFARHCAEYLAEMGQGFSRLENFVHVDNRLSIRWLKWLGFHFDPPAPYGLHQALFRRFWKEQRKANPTAKMLRIQMSSSIPPPTGPLSITTGGVEQ